MPKAWSTWYPDLLPHVPGCPGRLAVHELRRAAQEFFKASRAWKIVPTVFPVVAMQAEITIIPNSSALELVRIEMAWYDGKPLDPIDPEALDAGFADDWQVHTGTPSKYFQLTPGVVRLYPIPTTASVTGFKVRMAVRPSDTSTELPDDIALKFREDIFTGARALLMAYTDVPWSQPNKAMMLSAAAGQGAARANWAAAKSYGAGRIASRPKWC